MAIMRGCYAEEKLSLQVIQGSLSRILCVLVAAQYEEENNAFQLLLSMNEIDRRTPDTVSSFTRTCLPTMWAFAVGRALLQME